MMIKLAMSLTAVLLLLFNAGCTLDSTGLGSACGVAPELEGCFARSPEVPTRENPEMYIQIIQEDACHLSGHGWGLVIAYTFSTDAAHGRRVILNAIGDGDNESYMMEVELTGGGDGILLTVNQYRVGSGGEWRSWPEPYDRPYHLERVECIDDPGE